MVLRLLDLFPANDSALLLPILLVFHLLSVTAASVVAILVGSMCADVVEDHELKTGRRAEGVMAAANLFVSKTTSGIGIFASSMVLALVGFPESATPNSVAPEILRDLALVYVPFVIAMHACAILFIVRYRITRESHERTLVLLAERKLGPAVEG